MSDLVYRPGLETDVTPAARLFVESMTDLCRRNALPVTEPTVASIEPWYEHLRRTGIFEVAFDGETMVAFASGIVRDDLFFLSMFWTLPGRQRQGIGRPLLRRVWDEAARRGARTFGVWSSIDPAALGTYLRLGMRPVGPILTFGGEPKALPAHADAELLPLEVGVASSIDRAVRGTERSVDHAFLSTQKAVARAVHRAGRTLGYFYAHEGRVGPVAWRDDADGPSVLGAALSEGRRTSEKGTVTLSVPGPNHAAIDAALGAGLRIEGAAHFLATGPFGTIERYVPSGGALF